MKAQELIEKLGLEIERTKEKDNAALVTYPDKRCAIRVPRSWDLDTEDHQRVLFHECGHFVDQARHRGGHSQLTSRTQYGRFSTENRRLLQDNKKYLQEERKPLEVEIRVRYKHKTRTLADLLADPEVPNDIKERFRIAVKMKEAKWKHIAENYLDQEPEIFADGFAKYMMNKNKMLKEHPDLAILFELSSRNPSEEDLTTRKVKPPLTPLTPKKTVLKKRVSRSLRSNFVSPDLTGMR